MMQPLPEWIRPAVANSLLGVAEKTLARMARRGLVRAKGSKGAARRYRTADILKLKALPSRRRRFRDSAGIWIRRRVAESQFQIPSAIITLWMRAGCRTMNGATLKGRKVAEFYIAADGAHRPIQATYFHLETFRQFVKTWNSRLAEARDGDLRCREAAAFVRVGPDTVRRWARVGCPYLGGEKLQPRQAERARANKGSMLMPVYPLAELQRIREARRKLAASEDMTFPEAAKWCGVSVTTIHQWHRRGCPYLGGEKLPAVWSTIPADGKSVLRANRTDIELICAAMKQRPAMLVDESGRWYPLELLADMKLLQPCLQRWQTSCPLLPSRSAIRFRKAARRSGQNAAVETTYYFADDIELILRERNRDKLSEAVQLLSELLANGPLPVVQIFSIAKGKGFSQKRMRAAWKALGLQTLFQPGYRGKNVLGYWALPGQSLSGVGGRIGVMNVGALHAESLTVPSAINQADLKAMRSCQP